MIVEYAKIMPLNQTKSDEYTFIINVGINRFLEINLFNSSLFLNKNFEVWSTE